MRRSLNVDNQFANTSFEDAVLWVFTFMASGFMRTFFHRVLGSNYCRGTRADRRCCTAGFCLCASRVYARSEIKARNGYESSNGIKDYVLICGWNDKATGMIFTLTGDETLRRHAVVVVAEMDHDFPLEKILL